MSGLISFNNSTLKTHIRPKDLGDHLYVLSYSLFCVKLRCHGSGGQTWCLVQFPIKGIRGVDVRRWEKGVGNLDVGWREGGTNDVMTCVWRLTIGLRYTLRAERQSALMSKIKDDCLTRSGNNCTMATVGVKRSVLFRYVYTARLGALAGRCELSYRISSSWDRMASHPADLISTNRVIDRRDRPIADFSDQNSSPSPPPRNY